MTSKLKRTARRTLVETLPEEERLFLRGAYDQGMKGQRVVDAYEAKYKKVLALSTLYSWITRRVLPEKIEAEQAIAEASEFARLKSAHPDIPEDVLLRGFLRQRQASKAFREALVDPKVIIGAELEMRKLDIEQEKLDALKEKIELEKDKFAMVRDKLRGLRSDGSKKKLSPADYQRRLDEIYGIVESK